MRMKSMIYFFLAACLFITPGGLLSEDRYLEDRVDQIIKDITPELIRIRREIHAHPELAFQEFKTSALVAQALKSCGLEVRTGIAKTGVRGVLKGPKTGPIVGMRGDMDALPITEETGLPFASLDKAQKAGREFGTMHACGHDIHTTVLLGVAQVLSRLREEIPGSVVFIAQPAEEEGDGAHQMLRAGVFDDIKPEAIFAFHVTDTARAGFITYTPGYAGANCDGFDLLIKSEGCHGSAPHLCVDPIAVGAQIVVALQVLVSREIDVNKNTVITVGVFQAGSARNIIPRQAELKATIRTYGEGQRELVRSKVERLVANICQAANAEFELDYFFGTPSLYNNPELLREILPAVEKTLGGKEYLKEELPEMGGEDFSYFAREVPAVMLYLGVTPEGVVNNFLHSPAFVADEESIPVGVRVMSRVILDYLMGHTSNQKGAKAEIRDQSENQEQ